MYLEAEDSVSDATRLRRLVRVMRLEDIAVRRLYIHTDELRMIDELEWPTSEVYTWEG